MSHEFLVQQSSVSEQAGLGLYSNRSFNEGDFLELFYPGQYLKGDTYDELNDVLVNATNTPPSNDEELRTFLRGLKKRYGIMLHKANEDTTSQPNWDAIYDTFIEYQHAAQGGMIVANDYVWETGKIWYRNDPSYFPVFFNEPPPYKYFWNNYKKAYQLSRPNVFSLTAGKKVKFYAAAPIEVGDEMLLCYGPVFGREYDINLSKVVGCGGERFLTTVDPDLYDSQEDKERVSKYIEKMDNFQFQGDYYPRPAIGEQVSINASTDMQESVIYGTHDSRDLSEEQIDFRDPKKRRVGVRDEESGKWYQEELDSTEARRVLLENLEWIQDGITYFLQYGVEFSTNPQQYWDLLETVKRDIRRIQ